MQGNVPLLPHQHFWLGQRESAAAFAKQIAACKRTAAGYLAQLGTVPCPENQGGAPVSAPKQTFLSFQDGVTYNNFLTCASCCSSATARKGMISL